MNSALLASSVRLWPLELTSSYRKAMLLNYRFWSSVCMILLHTTMMEARDAENINPYTDHLTLYIFCERRIHNVNKMTN